MPAIHFLRDSMEASLVCTIELMARGPVSRQRPSCPKPSRYKGELLLGA